MLDAQPLLSPVACSFLPPYLSLFHRLGENISASPISQSDNRLYLPTQSTLHVGRCGEVPSFAAFHAILTWCRIAVSLNFARNMPAPVEFFGVGGEVVGGGGLSVEAPIDDPPTEVETESGSTSDWIQALVFG
jgi:hypothetical protein